MFSEGVYCRKLLLTEINREMAMSFNSVGSVAAQICSYLTVLIEWLKVAEGAKDQVFRLLSLLAFVKFTIRKSGHDGTG